MLYYFDVESLEKTITKCYLNEVFDKLAILSLEFNHIGKSFF